MSMKRQFVPIDVFKKNNAGRAVDAGSRAPSSLSEQETLFMPPLPGLPPQPGSNQSIPSSYRQPGQLPPPSWQPPAPPQGYRGDPSAFQQGPAQPLSPPPMQPMAHSGSPSPFLPQSGVPGSQQPRQRKPRFPGWRPVVVSILLFILV